MPPEVRSAELELDFPNVPSAFLGAQSTWKGLSPRIRVLRGPLRSEFLLANKPMPFPLQVPLDGTDPT